MTSSGLILNPEKNRVILLDVAGTTSSIDFVKNTLFPYAEKTAETFLKSHWEEDPIKNAVKDLNLEKKLELAEAVETFKKLTIENSTNAGVKTLQGLIYKQGYENGEIKGHIFPDVKESLETWSKFAKIAIYSTGSIESQKLLFTNTTEGDVTPQINKYFDQNVGLKTQSGSYEKIASEFEVKTEEMVFITDNIEEAKASKSAGYRSLLVSREGNADLPENAATEFTVIKSFHEITFENTSKRKNEEAAEEKPSKMPKTELAGDIADQKETAKEASEAESMDVESTPSNATATPMPESSVDGTPEKTEIPPEKTEDKTEAKTESEPVPQSKEDKSQLETPKSEPDTPKSEPEKPKSDPDIKPESEATEQPETTKLPADTTKTEEPKPEEIADKTEVQQENTDGDQGKAEEKPVVEEKVVAEEKIVAEKENDSVLANGVEKPEECEAKPSEADEKVEEDVKAKKIEQSAENPVGVEV